MRKLVIVISILLLAACGNNDQKPKDIIKSVKVYTVVQGDATVVRDFSGFVKAGNDVMLSFQVPGQIIELPVNQGQWIKKHELIGRLNQDEFHLHVAKAKAMEDQWQAQFERAQKLLPGGFVSKSDYDTIKAQYKKAVAARGLAEQELADTQLLAPFSGYIAVRYVDNFQFIETKQDIVQLHDLDNIDVVIDVPEHIMFHVTRENVVSLIARFAAAPQQAYTLEYKKHVLNSDPKTQTYRVYLSMNRPADLNVLAGMTATVTVKYYQPQTKTGISIPSSAVFTDENKNPYVFIIQPDQTLKRQAVSLGEVHSDEVDIISRLSAGDIIVRAGVHQLQAGEMVQPMIDQHSMD